MNNNCDIIFLVILMKILNQIGIKPNDINLFKTAFSHTSYANENRCKSYERLEFLGDAVLELLVSDYLFKNKDLAEGKMTKLRAHYVCETALYIYSLKLNLNDYLLLGKGELESGGKKSKAIVSDIFESFLGAIYLDQGIDKAREFFTKYVVPIIENHEIDFFDDYKSSLQEYVQTDKRSLEYILIKETGPSHNKEFTVEVRIDNIVYGKGKARSKKAAEQEAAKNALKKAQKGRL